MEANPTAYGQILASYACQPGHGRGRQFRETPSTNRTEYQRDRDRVIHSAAFRRLKHKTQVFVYHVGDYYRTRLTHSIEVSQIARSISRTLGLNEDLAEALALAHDLGHTPFGHSGEDALDAAMADFGGFDHNAQTLVILTRLERRYAQFDGLNLTWETLEGVVKHNGPLTGPNAAKDGGPIAQAVVDFDRLFPLELSSFAGGEAQVAALSDDIAYNNHDIDDGLRAGLISIADLAGVPLVGPVFEDVAARWPDLEQGRLVHESVRRLINAMVTDLIEESRRRIAAAAPESADDIRALDHPVVAFSRAMAKNDRALKDFLFARMYRHDTVNRMSETGSKVVRELFELFLSEPGLLPEDWQRAGDRPGGPVTARMVGDYIAGMTDRYALRAYERLIGPVEVHELT
ncbi:MAG: deoxyguanosinetriphosphate triphosphohydrolase [Alphaproteobacteria bacterium]|nr:MAG: deoxyguanosinetriphosphate triphosphohydrolase [Alphaproteobacteria bacterium]